MDSHELADEVNAHIAKVGESFNGPARDSVLDFFCEVWLLADGAAHPIGVQQARSLGTGPPR